MWNRLIPTRAGRRRARAARATGPLRDYYAAATPGPDTPTDALPLLAVDVETTGLDPTVDRVLSIGWVPVDGREIDLAGAHHVVLRTDREVGQSATVHGLTDDAVAAGAAPAEAIPHLLAALTGRVMLVHFAQIELRFLGRLCRELYGAPLDVPVVDTLELHRRLLYKGFDDEPLADELRLWNARTRYRLPRVRAHDALGDALACAELYLAQSTEERLTRTGTFADLR